MRPADGRDREAGRPNFITVPTARQRPGRRRSAPGPRPLKAIGSTSSRACASYASLSLRGRTLMSPPTGQTYPRGQTYFQGVRPISKLIRAGKVHESNLTPFDVFYAVISVAPLKRKDGRVRTEERGKSSTILKHPRSSDLDPIRGQVRFGLLEHLRQRRTVAGLGAGDLVGRHPFMLHIRQGTSICS
jgi:hypothetical protein